MEDFRECKHCKRKFDISQEPKGFMANHSRWCDENPKRKDYTERLNETRKLRKGIEPWNKGLTKDTDERVKKQSLSQKEGYLNGTTKVYRHDFTEEQKRKISEKALSSNHRRLRRKMVDYTMKSGEIVKLDSTWELVLAERLDSLDIKWVRPKSIKYELNGKKHNYFPDFYLEEFDVYLDPKNPYAFKVQKEKIDILNDTYDNIIWITTLEECKNFNMER